MICRDLTTHISVALLAVGILVLGFVLGTLQSCQPTETFAERDHRFAMEKLELEYKLKNNLSCTEKANN